jgi:hypothetical protein
VGLAAEFNTKPRYVVALVHARGKTYIDSENTLPQEDAGR